MTTGDGLGPALEAVLTRRFGRLIEISALHHEPYAYSTSFALTDITADLSDGRRLRLLRKDLGASGFLDATRTGKPAFLYEPRREIETYRRLLTDAGLGTPVCFGALVPDSEECRLPVGFRGSKPAATRHFPDDAQLSDDAQRCWLFLENVEARELYQFGEVEVWVEVARWLAHLHTSLDATQARSRNRHLISYDADWYRRWLTRARDLDDARTAQLEVVGRGLETALSRLADLPRSLVHGEFYPSNILVAEAASRQRICPVDWEMAGTGPGLLDLAALCTGWDTDTTRTIATAYGTALGNPPWLADEAELLDLIRCGQLCQAVQWLGWSPDWTAPAEHARDWLGDATQLAEGLLR